MSPPVWNSNRGNTWPGEKLRPLNWRRLRSVVPIRVAEVIEEPESVDVPVLEELPEPVSLSVQEDDVVAAGVHFEKVSEMRRLCGLPR